mgnify:CR=1 FL=1
MHREIIDGSSYLRSAKKMCNFRGDLLASCFWQLVAVTFSSQHKLHAVDHCFVAEAARVRMLS